MITLNGAEVTKLLGGNMLNCRTSIDPKNRTCFCIVKGKDVTDEICITCPVNEQIQDLMNLAKDAGFLKENNDYLRAQLDIALNKAAKYDCLIDTLFNTLCEKIAKQLV